MNDNDNHMALMVTEMLAYATVGHHSIQNMIMVMMLDNIKKNIYPSPLMTPPLYMNMISIQSCHLCKPGTGLLDNFFICPEEAP